MDVSIQKQQERNRRASTFCSIQALSELEDLHPHWGKLYSVFYQFKAKLFWRKSSQIHSAIMFYQLSEHSLAQSTWHIKLNIKNIKDETKIWISGLFLEQIYSSCELHSLSFSSRVLIIHSHIHYSFIHSSIQQVSANHDKSGIIPLEASMVWLLRAAEVCR